MWAEVSTISTVAVVMPMRDGAGKSKLIRFALMSDYDSCFVLCVRTHWERRLHSVTYQIHTIKMLIDIPNQK